MQGEITLRPYQNSLYLEARSAMKKHKHLCVQLSTGGGKTVIFSYLSGRVLGNKKKILILSNRCELLTQAGGTLEKFGITAEYVTPKTRSVPTGNCTVSMSQTLRRRYDKPEWDAFLRTIDLLIIDEAHMADFDYIFQSGIFDEKYVMGFTATPIRGGKQTQLGYQYGAILTGPSAQELIDMGFLVPARYFAVDAPDLSSVERDCLTGDYKQGQVFAAFDSNKRYEGVVKEYKRIALDRKTLVFCANQEHAVKTCIEFNSHGIPAKFLVSGIPEGKSGHDILVESKGLTGKREDIIGEFKRGEFKVLVNAGILTTGFDVPDLGCVVVNTATESLQRWLQIVGRGSRVASGKTDFLVLDFGGNLQRHGRYEDNRSWHLWHDEGGGGGLVMTKECPKDEKDKEGKKGCGRLLPISAQFCRFCGFIFKTEKELREAELVEIVGGEFRFSEMNPTQFMAWCELNGKSKPWAFGQLWMGSKDDHEFRRAMRDLGYETGYIWRLLSQYKKSKRKRYAAN